MGNKAANRMGFITDLHRNKSTARGPALKRAMELKEAKRLKRLEARRAATAASQAEGEGVEEC